MSSEFNRCPTCSEALTQVGNFWICPHHGQVSLKKPSGAMRIFLSYGHDANEELVRRIKTDLEMRGHDVWFDKSDIRFGEDWRRQITDGIIGSNRVLSFLSKYSTRDPGVCLDELAIAIGVKGGNIQTILVESETEVQAPPSIGHIQWLDMHDWKERRAVGEAAWEDWYQGKFAEIVQVIESDESRRFAGEIRTLEEHLKPISSDTRIAQLLKKPLIGRTWLFDAVDQWRNAADRASRLFWIMGAPGVGKSAFAAYLTHFGRDKVIAAQFCEYDKPDHRNAQRIVRTLAFQIATRLPDYRKLLLTLPEIQKLDRKNPSELFDYLLANPLKLSISGGRERYLIVIDALDEAGGNGRNELVEMLARNARRLPDWIGIIVTSRPESDVLAPLQGLNPFLLDTASDKNCDDIRDYLRRELALQLKGRADADRLLEQILDKSEGVFLYAERFCDDIQQGHLSLDRPERFPQGLGGMFYQFFQRQFPQERVFPDFLGFTLKDYKERCRPLLEMVAAAQEPPRLKFLYRTLGWNKYDQKEVADAFGSLLSATGGHIRMFHKSVVDWLCDPNSSGPFFVDVDAGHRRLADRCWQEFTSSTAKASWYARLYFQVHLDWAGEVKKKQIIENRLCSSVRTVRVYVSSTFRDMHAERDLLVKQVFPQLRRLCESRGVAWGEVDLRWGVPHDENVLPLLLAEIEHCRPFFIGILGEKYGWVPSIIPAELIEMHPWLREFQGKSVNELEIIKGVLLETETLGYGLMYFRSPHFVEQLPGAVRRDFETESGDYRLNLNSLKQRIRDAADEEVCLLRENYSSPEELGRWILDDFGRLLNTFLPDQRIVDPLAQEAEGHEAYGRSRRHVYIARPEYYARLDGYAAGNGDQLLVILGETGSGKSALVANWTYGYRQAHPDVFVLEHYIGATPGSTHWAAMLQRIMAEFKRQFSLTQDIPEAPDVLRSSFGNWLQIAAAKGRVVLVLDGLSQIEDRDGGPDLVWLPPVIPANVRLVVSTLPGRPLDDLMKRGCPVLTVEPLSPPEREMLIDKYLKRYAKALSPERRRRIAAAPQSGNGLCLSTLLNELRLFGSYEDLDKRIGWYLEAADPFELYGKVIQRWEQDYGQPDPACENVVRESLVRLWAARRGLSESELLESLGTTDLPMPRALWRPLYLAADDALVNRGGLLTFAHDFLREAVRAAYLPTTGDQQGSHRTLAVYFHDKPQGPRQLDELPWQWQQAAAWQKLADLLAQPGFFGALWEKDQFEANAYWAGIETHSPLRMEQVYAPVILEPTRDDNHAWRIGSLLNDTGKPEAALCVRARLVEHYREQGDDANLQAALGGQAVILRIRGDLDGAMALHKEEERLCRELGNKDGLQRTLGNQALILYDRGDLDGAMVLHKESECLCRELGNKAGLSRTLGNQALILQDRGDLDGAMALHKEEERLCRELGNKNGLQRALGNQGVILQDRGDLDGAMALHKEEERLCRELGNKDGLQRALGNQGVILQDRGDLDGAMALLKEQERLCRELGNPQRLSISLANQARLLRGTPDRRGEARRLAEEALAIATRHGYQQLVPRIQRIRDSISSSEQ